MKITEKSVGTEQGHFRNGKVYVDMIFALRMIDEKYLEKAKK